MDLAKFLARALVPVLALWVADCAGAQAGEPWQAVERAVETGQWNVALPLLLALEQRGAADSELQHLAARLDAVAAGLQAESALADALLARRSALRARQRQHGDRDHADVAVAMHQVARCLDASGRPGEALPLYQEVLAMQRRLHAGADHVHVAFATSNLAACLWLLGRAGEALPLHEAALAMHHRLHGDRDDPRVAAGRNEVAVCLEALGRADEALPHYEAALAVFLRLHPDRDHAEVARLRNNVANCLWSLGRGSEALPHFDAALAMLSRLHGERDHPDVASVRTSRALCLDSTGRPDEALPQFEAALAMRRRLYGDRDHPDVAGSLNGVATCLQTLGRHEDALRQFEAALAMWQRLYGERDHPQTASGWNNLAGCLAALERWPEALPAFEAAAAMWRRLHGDRDHPYVARVTCNVAGCLEALGRSGEARQQYEAAVAMWRRLYGDRDHPDVAFGRNGLATCLRSSGLLEAALAQYEAALATWTRLYGDRDHAFVAGCLTNASRCLAAMGRTDEAWSFCTRACDMIERLRGEVRLSGDLQQAFFDSLKRGNAFELMQALAAARDPSVALAAAERSRSRTLLDLLARQHRDPLDEAEQLARRDGNESEVARLQALRAGLQAASAECDRLLQVLIRLDARELTAADRAARRVTLLAESDAAVRRHRQLLDERARVLGDVLPVGRVRTAAEIQQVLRDGELLLEFTIADDVALLLVVGPTGAVEAVTLPAARAAVQRLLPVLMQRSSRAQLAEPRGRDPETAVAAGSPEHAANELFAALVPPAVWQRVRTCRRVFVAAHRSLHRLPFELLVTEVRDGQAMPWLDSGPPIAYVPSGSVLHWLRRRGPQQVHGAAASLLAIGDPEPMQGGAVPERGADPAGAARHGGVERVRFLPRLAGARAEVEAIAAAWTASGRGGMRLLGEEATESAVFERAAVAGYLHFACHGIAEEYAGHSLSMLVLTAPGQVRPGDDGLLQLSDLLRDWPGRLASTRLVVLSACRTNVGPTLRDEAPQALPLGFLFAGAPAVVSSLWAVDDASTRELMIAFYQRLLAGEGDALAALAAAKKAMRRRHADPFHWAAFLYLGDPDPGSEADRFPSPRPRPDGKKPGCGSASTPMRSTSTRSPVRGAWRGWPTWASPRSRWRPATTTVAG